MKYCFYLGLVLFSTSTTACATCPNSDPDETLNCYFHAVDTEDEAAIAAIYLDFTGYHFNTSPPTERKRLKNRTLTEPQVEPLPDGSVPKWARQGNREFLVEETYDNRTHTVSFFLMEKAGLWYLAGHTVHGAP